MRNVFVQYQSGYEKIWSLLFCQPSCFKRFILLCFVGSDSNLDMDSAKRKAQLVHDKKKFDEALPKIFEQVTVSRCAENKDAIEHYRKVCS